MLPLSCCHVVRSWQSLETLAPSRCSYPAPALLTTAVEWGKHSRTAEARGPSGVHERRALLSSTCGVASTRQSMLVVSCLQGSRQAASRLSTEPKTMVQTPLDEAGWDALSVSG